MAKLTNVSGRDLDVDTQRARNKRGSYERVGGVRVAAGQVLDVVLPAEDVGDAYLVDERLYPKKLWQLVEPRKSSSGKADGAEPDSEKE